MDNLAKKLDDFLKSHEIEQITTDVIKETFSMKEKTEDGYTILHALTDKVYPTAKVIKMIEALLPLKVNLNNQAVYGKYTFLHLALYSKYPLSFFEQAIPLALENGFDINSRDEDGDTLLHSAIYSEDYLDKIFPLFDLVGPTFNIETKNSNGENLLDALKEAKQQASRTRNKAWLSQLTCEEKEIIAYVTKRQNEKKEKEVTLQKQKEYQIFLKSFKTKLKNAKTMEDITQLLDLTAQIQEPVYKNEVVEKLTSTKQVWSKTLQAGQLEKMKIENLLAIFPNNKALQAENERLKEQDFTKLPLKTIPSIIESTQKIIDTQVNVIVEETVETINSAFNDLKKVEEITAKPLLEEAKEKIYKKEK